MRGQARCRAHRDAELGSRGAGPPPNNLNALKHGRHSHPLPLPDLAHLASHIATRPADLPLQIGLAARSLQARTDDPLLTLAALRRLLSQLTPIVATCLFNAELQGLLQALPPPARPHVQAIVEQYVPQNDPKKALQILRKIKSRKNN
jgi:hypothetical protein